MTITAVRGAIQLEADSDDQVIKKTVKLITSLVRENGIREKDTVSIHFTQTEDIVSMKPATALRSEGFREVPLFCMAEPAVPGDLPLTIRVLITFRTRRVTKVKHIYLDGAEALRPDL